MAFDPQSHHQRQRVQHHWHLCICHAAMLRWFWKHSSANTKPQSQATGLSSTFAHIHKSTSGLCNSMEYETPCSRPHSLHSRFQLSNYPRPCERGGVVLHLHWDLELQKCSRLPKDPASDVLSCSHAYKAYNSSLIKGYSKWPALWPELDNTFKCDWWNVLNEYENWKDMI